MRLRHLHPDDVPYGPGNSDYEYERLRDEEQPSLFQPQAHEVVANTRHAEFMNELRQLVQRARTEIDNQFDKILVFHARSIAQRRRFLRIRQLQGAA